MSRCKKKVIDFSVVSQYLIRTVTYYFFPFCWAFTFEAAIWHPDKWDFPGKLKAETASPNETIFVLSALIRPSVLLTSSSWWREPAMLTNMTSDFPIPISSARIPPFSSFLYKRIEPLNTLRASLYATRSGRVSRAQSAPFREYYCLINSEIWYAISTTWFRIVTDLVGYSELQRATLKARDHCQAYAVVVSQYSGILDIRSIKVRRGWW